MGNGFGANHQSGYFARIFSYRGDVLLCFLWKLRTCRSRSWPASRGSRSNGDRFFYLVQVLNAIPQ
jgi:hypothetical protein